MTLRPSTGRTCLFSLPTALLRVVVSSSTTSSHRSSSWFTVAFVRGLRRSSTWFSSRVRTRSASRAADGPRGTVSTRQCFFFDTGSMPA